MINHHATTKIEGISVDDGHGLALQYNGVNIHQTHDYIKLSCETYLDHVLQMHGWDKPSSQESDYHDSVPLNPTDADVLAKLVGPAEGTMAHSDLKASQGFSYHQVLGELIYAYVICHLDIGYAATFLARFSQAPDVKHYQALKNIIHYLHRMKSWGLMYWHAPSPFFLFLKSPSLELFLIHLFLPFL